MIYGQPDMEDHLNLTELYSRVAPSAQFVNERVLRTGYQKVVREIISAGVPQINFNAIELPPFFQPTSETIQRLHEIQIKLGLERREMLSGRQYFLETVAYIYE